MTGKTGIKGVVAIYADGSGVSGYGEILDLAKTCKTTRPMRFSQQKVLNIAQYCFVAIWLVQIPAAIGASFDCTKATTEIEKMICSNTELSKLDQVMAETYNAALLKSTEANALKNRQRQWLKDLRYCKTSNCLQGAYDARIRGLRDGEGAKTYDTPEFQSVREKDKATKVKAILAQYPMQIHDGVKEESRAFCNTFYEALRTTSPEIIYIEPVLRTDDPTHPALGEYLACDNYEPVSAYVYFVMRELGRRGFRLYRVDMDGHPENGLEEYLYGEDPPSQFNTFSAQVLRVDLQKCIVTDGVYASPENPVQSGNNGIYGFSALVQFQNQFYFYDLSRIGTEGDYYSINLSAYSPVKPGKRSVEIKEDIVIHYDGANIFGEFPAADICSWKVPHNQ